MTPLAETCADFCVLERRRPDTSSPAMTSMDRTRNGFGHKPSQVSKPDMCSRLRRYPLAAIRVQRVVDEQLALEQLLIVRVSEAKALGDGLQPSRFGG